MIRFFCICLVLSVCAFSLTNRADAAWSYSSQGFQAGYGSSGRVFGEGRFRPLKRWHQNRVANGRAWGQRGYGSAGQISYGSAGQTGYGSAGRDSYEAPAPEAAPVDYCPAESEPLTFELDVRLCPSGLCPRRQLWLGGGRKNPRWS